jgi:hypothetical protein
VIVLPLADRDMSKQTQKARQDGKEMMLGALFLVDHAPECPEETTWHDFSNLTIAEHLKRHSYYHHQKGKRELATVAKMRSRILYICDNYATAEMPKLGKPDKEFKDKVDVLFGYGGIELVKEAFLERQGYEKRKFPESRLNKHVSEADTSGDARIDRRLEDTPGNAKTDGRTEDEMPEEISGSDASKTRSHGVGEEECQESRAAPPFIQPTLPSPANHVGTPLRPPDLSHTAPGLNILDTCESCNQSGAAQDEQVAPSRDEEPQLHDSIDPETQASSGHNGTSYVTEEASAAPVVTHSGPRNELVSGTKRKPMQDHGPHKRQCQTENATYQNNSNVLRLRLKAATPAQQRSKTPPTINGTKSLEAPQSAVAGREKQPEPQLAILNLDEQGRNMQSLYSAIQKAIDAILSSIGPIRNTPSPLHPESSGLLRDLYARCWGSRWEEVRVRQTGDHVFTTPQITASLLSAFLYDRVLARGLQLEEIVSNVVEMGGSLGEALLEEFDIGTRGQSHCFSNEHAYDGLTRSRNHNRQKGTHYRSTKSLLQVSTGRRDRPTAIEARSRQPRQ